MAAKGLSTTGCSSVASRRLGDLRLEVAALETLDIHLLRKRWRSVMGRPAPAHLSRTLLFRILAWRLQTEALGEINSHFPDALGPRGDLNKRQPLSAAPKGFRPLARPGTLLAREYGGVTHRVMAMEEGYSWNGRTFRSLSEVATAITGTKWNGPRFFGLGSPRASQFGATRDTRAEDGGGGR